jgi:SP family myo-inositol transporter-like MFS transporter 13
MPAWPSDTSRARLTRANGRRGPRYAAVPALMVYLVAFGTGLSAVPWVVNAEIYPLHLRSVATGALPHGRHPSPAPAAARSPSRALPAAGLATLVNWACNFAVSASFLSLVGALGAAGTFALYAAVASAGFVGLYLTMPETAGLPLESIQALFVKSEVPGEPIYFTAAAIAHSLARSLANL